MNRGQCGMSHSSPCRSSATLLAAHLIIIQLLPLQEMTECQMTFNASQAFSILDGLVQMNAKATEARIPTGVADRLLPVSRDTCLQGAPLCATPPLLSGLAPRPKPHYHYQLPLVYQQSSTTPSHDSHHLITLSNPSHVPCHV